ncbi:hypothetical protein [Methanosphaera sp. BMS]|uniref:hypothetical protein n=1 Tax=Methanosphaera sp. BMS TaxID=1789762 RepID=UPI000DC1F6A9|nr:hypothetical protein [Methanosphaera sp. BMS]AWX31709.1 hypothetical protein AW729_00785 [Methanosphaera sp. BMS]
MVENSYIIDVPKKYEEVLRIILNEENDIESRMDLIEDITSKEVLFKLARDSQNMTISKKCVEKINDDDLLYKLMLEDVDYETIEYAARKIKNKGLLLNILKNMEDYEFTLIQIILENLDDCNLLLDVILNEDYDSSFRIIAMEELSKKYPFMLPNVLLNIEDGFLKSKCREYITDEYFLYTQLPDDDVFLTESEEDFIDLIINSIDNKQLLNYILDNSNNEYVKNTVKKRMDENKDSNKKFILANIFSNENHNQEHMNMTYNDYFEDETLDLNDMDKNIRYLLLNPNPSIRMNAIKNTQNQELLKQVVLNDPDRKNRLLALDRILDEEIIKEIYDKSEYDDNLRENCLKKINDEQYFKNLLIRTPHCIEMLWDKLNDETIIRDLLLNNWNNLFYPFLDKLMDKINNPDNHTKLASFADNWKVRRIAIIQIEKKFDKKYANIYTSHTISEWGCYKICLEGKYLDVKIRAVNKINDNDLLYFLFLLGSEYIIRNTAYRKLIRPDD